MSAHRRLEKRERARRRLDEFMSNPDILNIIYYSCESFYDAPDGASPRITSIAVRNFGSGQTESFSIHQVAERKRIQATDINQHYDDLERKMLCEFYDYANKHSRHNWIHWNMRDINYGFPAIAYRYRVLGGDPGSIDTVRLLDLASCIIDIYGPAYVGHPRLQRLMQRNHISDQHFLSGADEARAFEESEYVKLHQSTLRKVDVIANIAIREWEGTLETNARWYEEYGLTIAGFLEMATNTTLFKLVSAIAILATIAGFVMVLV